MTSASFRVAAAALLSLSLCCSGVSAGEIAIDNEDYAQLPASAQEKLVTEMKGKGLLAADDTVTNAAPPADKKDLGPAALLPFVPVVCKIIAEAKKQDEIGKCTSKPEADAQAKCKTDVETKFTTIDTVCNIIKIF
jgi:hypothetical protein